MRLGASSTRRTLPELNRLARFLQGSLGHSFNETGDGSLEDPPLSDRTHVMGGGDFASALDRSNGNH